MLFLLLAVALILEFLLRLSGTYMLHSEVNSGLFWLEFGQRYQNGHRFTHEPGQLIVKPNSEFDFRCLSNSFGYRDRSYLANPSKPYVDILFLGDSFTEGVGSDCLESMPHYFERLHPKDSLLVVNAGIAGSDVFYEYKLLEEDISAIRPQLVLQGVNTTDINEYHTRGGFERFVSGGLTAYREAPVNLSLYRYFHLFRWYVHEGRQLSPYTFLPRTAWDHYQQLAESEIVAALTRTDSLTTANGARYVVFFHPLPHQTSTHESVTELDRLYQACRTRGINSLLLTNDFKQLADSLGSDFSGLSWPIDGHFNNRGYSYFANILKKNLDVKFPEWKKYILEGDQ